MTYVPNAAFEASSLSERVKIINQPKQAPIEELLVNDTDFPADTYGYPGDGGSTMLGFEHISVDGTIADADGQVDAYMLMTNDVDSVSPEWKRVRGQDDINGGTVNGFQVVNNTLEYAISYNVANFKRWKWVMVFSGSTNSGSANARRV